MTTTTHPGPAKSRTGSAKSNGHRPSVAPPGRRVRLPELAIGIFVTVVFALGAVLWHLNTTTKVPALAAAESIDRGDVIEATDLRVVYVASDDPLAHMASGDSALVVGRVALVDLAPGTLLTPGMVADGAGSASGDGVVGLALDAGQYPAFGLSPGDRVNVVGSDPGVVEGTEAGDGRALVRAATVFAVEDLTGDRKLVSVLMGEDDAEVVAAAAAGSGGIRLVWVAP